MAILEGVGSTLRYKFYSTGTINASTKADLATAPGATGGQLLRRTSVNLQLESNSTKSAEIIPSKQVRSYRRTSSKVTGSVSGELSPVTYLDWFEAALRGTKVVGATSTVVSMPSSGHVSRKLLIERHDEAADRSRLYTEGRITGFNVNVPAEGNATVEFMVMARDRTTVTGTAAPYLTAPADITATDVVNSLAGEVLLAGTRVGLITSISIKLDTNASAPSVVGQSFAPDILLGTASVTGDISFLLDDADTASSLYEAETEFTLKITLANAATGGQQIEFLMPRVKLGSANEQIQGETEQTVQCSFQALENADSGVGPLTTLQISDTGLVD